MEVFYMKKIISVILLAALIAMCCGITAFASTKVVTTGEVNMRVKANKKSTIVKVIPSGVTLNVTKAKKDGRGVKWGYAKYDGKYGWVSGKYLKKVSSLKRVYGTASSYIRTRPSKTAAKVGGVSKGEYVTYLGKYQKDSRGVRWYAVSKDKTHGWVSSKYTKIVK